MPRFMLVPEAHLLLVQGDRIFLLRRRNTGYEDGAYSVVAGPMEEGDGARGDLSGGARGGGDPPDAGRAGVRAGGAPRRPRAAGQLLLRRAALARQAPEHGTGKGRRSRLVPVDRLPDEMVPYVRRAIESWRSGRYYGESGWDEARAPSAV